MSSGLDTDKARALQATIQKELVRRGYTVEDDLVMADYISIMVINSKTSKQITSELEDLIGEDFDASFTDWLFEKAAKPFFDEQPTPSAAPVSQPTTSPIPTHVPNDPPPSAPNGQHNNRFRGPPPSRSSGAIFQQAISATAPAQKRSASMRSPSPSSSHPAKARRTDLPDRPRAMRDEHGNPPHRGPANSRSLLERVGGPAGPNRGAMPPQEIDRIQAQIDAVTQGGGPPMDVGPMFFPPGGMDMTQVNPMMLQEMMATQMMLMQQMSMAMGAGMAPPMGFGMNGFQPQPGMNQHQQQQPMPHRGRGGRPTRGGWSGPGRGGHAGHDSPVISEVPQVEKSSPASAPQPPMPQVAPSAPSEDSSAVPPKICKFGNKCTNGACRFSHPTPAAGDDGLVLSAESCEAGRNCKDKDCAKSHPSAATSTGPQPNSAPPAAAATTPCKFGNACTRPGCAFIHPRDGASASFAGKPCRFATACTRADCPFTHPPGRVLPSTFHRGLSTNSTPASPGQFTSHNRSMSFKPNPAAAPFSPAKPAAAGPEAGAKEEKQPAEVAV